MITTKPVKGTTQGDKPPKAPKLLRGEKIDVGSYGVCTFLEYLKGGMAVVIKDNGKLDYVTKMSIKGRA